jgi:hypothetical protein
MSRRQLAELVGTTDSVISRLEDADYAGHSLGMLQRISAALNSLPVRRKTAGPGRTLHLLGIDPFVEAPFWSIDGIKALLTEHPFSVLPPSRVTGTQQTASSTVPPPRYSIPGEAWPLTERFHCS